MAGKLLRTLKWGVGGTLAGGSVGATAAYLHHHDWDVRSTGVVRFGRAVIACAGVVVDYKLSLRNVTSGTAEYAEAMSQVHLRSAERLRAMCCVNRGCFIKVGQHIGALDYLLPTEYVQTFKVLHSDAPQSPVSELEMVFREETGREIKEVFSYFDDKPCGTASLAQVHRATYHDGRTAAVKIQHPQVKAHSFVDMKTMDFLISVVSRIFPNFQFSWLAEETKRNLPRELDFYLEARNCESVSIMFKDFKFLKIIKLAPDVSAALAETLVLCAMHHGIEPVQVPAVHWDLTTERVLTMEFCEGGQINDKKYFTKHNIDVNKVSQMLGKLYSEMIFVKGYVHCDPHPGNVLVHKSDKDGTQIVLLDHGLYATLSDKFRRDYCKLWRSLISADEPGIKEHSEQLGIGKLYPLFACMVTGRTWKNVATGIDKIAVTSAEDEEIKENAGLYLSEITDILNLVPREMLLIFKTNDLLRGIEQNLGTRANARSFVTMSRCCLRAVYDHEAHHSKSWLGWSQVVLTKHAQLFKVSLYELYLWLTSTGIAKYLATVRNSTAAVAAV